MPLVYRAETDIPAPADAVWKVLRDFDNYGEWNVFNPVASSSGEIGTRIRLTVVLRGLRVTAPETVRELTAPSRLVWGFDFWVIWAERVQTLTPTPEGCHYVTEDRIGGLLSPIVGLMFGRALQSGFEQMTADLSQRCQERGLAFHLQR